MRDLQNKRNICSKENTNVQRRPKAQTLAKRPCNQWSFQQNIIYVQYLQKNSLSFQDQWTRRSRQVFNELSTAIKTKTHKQCKSHHQKMMDRFQKIDRIVRHFKNFKFSSDSPSQIKQVTEPEMILVEQSLAQVDSFVHKTKNQLESIFHMLGSNSLSLSELWNL